SLAGLRNHGDYHWFGGDRLRLPFQLVGVTGIHQQQVVLMSPQDFAQPGGVVERLEWGSDEPSWRLLLQLSENFANRGVPRCVGQDGCGARTLTDLTETES